MNNDKILIKKSTIFGVILLYLLMIDSSFPSILFNINKTFFYWAKFVISALVIIYATFFYKRSDEKDRVQLCKKIKIILAYPCFMMIVYSIFIWILNNTAKPFITRGISIFLSSIIPILLGCSLFKIYGDRILKISLISIVLMSVTNYCVGFYVNGISFLPQLIDPNCYETRFRLYKELHEIAFIMGLFCIYYFMNFKGDLCIEKKWFFVSLIIFYLSWKRIGMLALILAIVFYFSIKKLNMKLKKIFLIICGIIAILLCLIYVYFSSTDILERILENYGINMMGRNILYQYFRNFCSFSIDFLGNGIGFVSKQFEYVTVYDFGSMFVLKQGLHNDLYNIFIEIGLVGYIWWLIYWFIKIPKKIYKNFGMQAVIEVFSFIIFAFITYTTDNTLRYFCFQLNFTFFVLLICYKYLLKKD